MRRTLVVALALLSAPAWARAQISPGPLARPHAQLDGALQCAKCHAGGRGGGKEQMTGLCLNCHKEIAWLVDRGRGVHGAPSVKTQRCASCHPEHAGRDFAMVSWDGGTPERFDHTRAGWALEGSHARQKCSACHKPTFRISPVARLSQRPRSDPGWVGLDRTCTACHEDVHRGALGNNCLKCHNVESFTTINRASFDHDGTRYPLRGRHTTVACEKCHDFAGGRVAANRPFATCAGCHTPDPHGGAATLAGRVVDCASCHAVEGWRPSTYTVAQHRLTRYPLEGRHALANCGGCHTRTQGAAGGGVVMMRPATSDCTTCHVDPHRGQLPRCTECHDVHGFRPTSVDVAAHARYRFPLEGAHRAVECVDCHADMRRPLATSTLRLAGWSGAPLLFGAPRGGCTGCHATPHGTQFAAHADGGACQSCHDVQTFRPARRFDHDRDAAFSLKGAHAAVACDRCHRTTRGAGAKPVVVYRPVPTACEACHK